MISKTNTQLYFWLGLLVGIVCVTLPNVGYNFGKLPGDLGDTRFNIYVLEHATQFFTGKLDSYWSADFMYPEPEVISYSDNLLGTATIYSLFRILGMDLFTAFQGWFICLSILNYWSAYKLTRFLTKNAGAATIAAFIFAFSIALTAQLNHAQTIPRFAIPLAIYFLLKWSKNLNTKYFLYAISFAVYQFYCGIYLGFLFSICFLILLLGIILYKRKEILLQLKTWENSLYYLGATVLNLLFLYLLFEPYIRRSKNTGQYPYEQIVQSIPTWKSYLSAPPGTLFSSQLNSLSNAYPSHWDHWIFSGSLATLAFVLLPFWILYRYKKKLPLPDYKYLILLLAGYLSLICFMRFGSHSFYYFIYQLPGFGAMRVITRVINVEILFFALSLAAIYPIIQQKSKLKPNLFFILFLTLLTLDNYVKPETVNATSKQVMQNRHTKMLAKMQHLKAGTIVSYEPHNPSVFPHEFQLDAMLAAQELGLKCINGYSATCPPAFSPYWYHPDEKNREIWLSTFPKTKQKIEVIH